jgi:hypothetical protein
MARHHLIGTVMAALLVLGHPAYGRIRQQMPALAGLFDELLVGGVVHRALGVRRRHNVRDADLLDGVGWRKALDCLRVRNRDRADVLAVVALGVVHNYPMLVVVPPPAPALVAVLVTV